MHPYQGVVTRFLREEERLIQSQEKDMPLVIEADGASDVSFLQNFLKTHSQAIIADLATYGAVLLRGFALKSDAEFEQIVLSLPEFQGISEAFMSENGRDHVDNLKFVLHTNSVYKTGGTLYLGGFHTENYYSADVPSYICFACFEPSPLGGETGLINAEKLYNQLNESLKEKLEKQRFFVGQWLISEVAAQYEITRDEAIQICKDFELPFIGEGEEESVLIFKSSVLEHPLTQKKALQINLFELKTLNDALRKCFIKDYKGKDWFWHRFFWRLPMSLFNMIEKSSVMAIAFFNSPKKSFQMLKTRFKKFKMAKNEAILGFDKQRVGTCFEEQEIQALAKAMRDNYCSCLWKKGDILLVDNKKVMHAGMPGKGNRLIRAMICNPLKMSYSAAGAGCIKAEHRETESIGAYMAARRSGG